MFATKAIETDDKAEFYGELVQQLEGLLSGERDAIANAANTAALLFTTLPDLNWAGFYFLKSPGELVLGPFQGKPACVRIAVGRGVCGAAVEQRRTMLVEDVHAFADHIACDAASRSELVVPLIRDGRVLGVIDLDSPHVARFDRDDQRGIEAVAQIYVKASDELPAMTRTTMILPVPRHGTAAARTTRRRFLPCAAALLAGTLISAAPGRISFAADSDAQWARLQRGLSQEAMADCRKVADRLRPRLGELLKGPQWESQTFKAIADELKQPGVYPDHPPPRSPECTEAESLRGEAASTKSSDDAVSASMRPLPPRARPCPVSGRSSRPRFC